MVYGIHEAASFYFNKRPSQLSLEESIFLASIVPKPKHFKNSFTADGRLQESQEGYFHLIAERLAKKEVITDAQAAQVNINNVVLKGVAKSSFVSESWQQSKTGKKGRKPVDELTREQGAAQCSYAAWNLSLVNLLTRQLSLITHP